MYYNTHNTIYIILEYIIFIVLKNYKTSNCSMFNMCFTSNTSFAFTEKSRREQDLENEQLKKHDLGAV